MNKLYKFRDLSLKDQMRIEVDFYGEPVEISEEQLEEIIDDNMRCTIHDDYLEQDCRNAAKAILNLLK